MPIVGSFGGASARAYGAGAGGVLTGDFESIQTITAGSAVANIEFTSIPQTYTHLQIRAIGRSTFADNDLLVQYQLNGDTGTNYSEHAVYGTGASRTSYQNTNTSVPGAFRVTGASSTANSFGVGVMDILDYRNTNKFKTSRCLIGHDQNGAGLIFLWSSNWRNTNAITSIKFFPSSGSFATNSTFALYGVTA